MAGANDQNSAGDPTLENPTIITGGLEAEVIADDDVLPPATGDDAAVASPVAVATRATAAAPPTAWEKGVAITEHLAALKAQHAAELETALLRERIKRLEVEKDLAEARAQLATQSSTSSTVESSTEPATRAARRQREKEWDELSYVPVENYRGNPFRGPDPGVHLANPQRPQCFSLDNDPIHKLLVDSKTPMRFEYEITHPVLYYFWGVKQFLESDFAGCVLDASSTVEQRTAYLEALTNSTARIFEWLAVRHALITKRARTPKSDHSYEVLEHYQNEVYAFVGSAPPTSSWLDSMETAFEDKVFVAQLKSLASESAKKKSGASSGESGGGGAGGKGKVQFNKKGKGFVPLADAGRGGGAGKQ